MIIDLPTLMFASAFVGMLCGSALLLVWLEHRTPAVLAWAAGDVVLGLGVMLLAVGFVSSRLPLFMIGLTLLLVAPALTWAGIRLFYGLPARPLLVGAAVCLWLATIGVAGALGGPDWVIPAMNTAIVVAFNAATIWELRRDRGEVLPARVPLVVLLALNILIYLLAIPEAMTGRLQGMEPPPLASLFGLVHFETLIYLVGSTIFLFSMVKERSERQYLRDAETDALTGLANRRAFLQAAERIAGRCRRRGDPVAVVVFDLDHFKLVNDTFGHAFGDVVLQTFAKAAREALRPGDLVGRVGGEEFFAILPAANLNEGCAVADRVRKAFADAARTIEGRNVAGTVSAGVTVDGAPGATLASLFEEADSALYTAKLNGRNRIQCGDQLRAKKSYPRLVQVA